MKCRMIDATMVVNFVVEAAMHRLFLAWNCYPNIRLEQRLRNTLDIIEQEKNIEWVGLKTKAVSCDKFSHYMYCNK